MYRFTSSGDRHLLSLGCRVDCKVVRRVMFVDDGPSIPQVTLRNEPFAYIGSLAPISFFLNTSLLTPRLSPRSSSYFLPFSSSLLSPHHLCILDFNSTSLSGYHAMTDYNEKGDLEHVDQR